MSSLPAAAWDVFKQPPCCRRGRESEAQTTYLNGSGLKRKRDVTPSPGWRHTAVSLRGSVIIWANFSCRCAAKALSRRSCGAVGLLWWREEEEEDDGVNRAFGWRKEPAENDRKGLCIGTVTQGSVGCAAPSLGTLPTPNAVSHPNNTAGRCEAMEPRPARPRAGAQARPLFALSPSLSDSDNSTNSIFSLTVTQQRPHGRKEDIPARRRWTQHKHTEILDVRWLSDRMKR